MNPAQRSRLIQARDRMYAPLLDSMSPDDFSRWTSILLAHDFTLGPCWVPADHVGLAELRAAINTYLAVTALLEDN